MQLPEEAQHKYPIRKAKNIGAKYSPGKMQIGGRASVGDGYQLWGGSFDDTDPRVVRASASCCGCIIPIVIALTLTIAGTSSRLLSTVEGMGTLSPPAEEITQLTILPNGCVLLPNGT